MNTIIKELPAIYFEGKAKDPDQVVGEADLTASMYEFKVFLPAYIPIPAEEMSEQELLAAAEAAGTFKFLDAESEDIKQDFPGCRRECASPEAGRLGQGKTKK